MAAITSLLEGGERILLEQLTFVVRTSRRYFRRKKMAWSTSLLITVSCRACKYFLLHSRGSSDRSFSLLKRGEVFGDESLNTHSPCVNIVPSRFQQVIISAHTFWSPGGAGNFFRQADVVTPLVFTSLDPYVPSPSVLTGIFLFGSTTARSSGGLQGWNCGYSFNVSFVTFSLVRHGPRC